MEVIGSLTNVFLYPILRSRESSKSGSQNARSEVNHTGNKTAEDGDDSVFVSIETDEGTVFYYIIFNYVIIHYVIIKFVLINDVIGNNLSLLTFL